MNLKKWPGLESAEDRVERGAHKGTVSAKALSGKGIFLSGGEQFRAIQQIMQSTLAEIVSTEMERLQREQQQAFATSVMGSFPKPNQLAGPGGFFVESENAVRSGSYFRMRRQAEGRVAWTWTKV